MAGTTRTATTTRGRFRRSGKERRRPTAENRVVRHAIDVLGWAAEAPVEREDDVRATLRRTHAQAVETLRQAPPNRFMSILEMRVAPLPATIVIAVFLLGLGIGLSFGGST